MFTRFFACMSGNGVTAPKGLLGSHSPVQWLYDYNSATTVAETTGKNSFAHFVPRWAAEHQLQASNNLLQNDVHPPAPVVTLHAVGSEE
jgi:hypothetical protein